LFALALLAASLPTQKTLGAQQALSGMCSAFGDGVNGIQSALAATTGADLGRWNPVTDFTPSRSAPFVLMLSPTGKARCSDGSCWRVQALLDLQKAPTFYVSNGNGSRVAVNTGNLIATLNSRFTEQQNCEARGGSSALSCTAEQHKLSLMSSARGACSAIYTLAATTTAGGKLQQAPQFKNKLMWAGYPANPNFAFSASATTVTIAMPLDLVDDGFASSPTAINACTRISRANLTGRACTCGGTVGKYVVSAWNRQTYTCKS
jgi:hypothetical protein